MNNWGKRKSDPSNDISTKTWINHFENLLNDDNAYHLTAQGEQKTFEPILDGRITLKELKDALHNLKGGKAPGPDEIIGEYLKIFGQIFEDMLLKLVNVIFFRAYIPIWVGPKFFETHLQK